MVGKTSLVLMHLWKDECENVPRQAIHPLTYQLSFLRWEKHVDVEWVENGRKLLVTVGYGGSPRLELPTVDLKSGSVRVGRDRSDFPSDVTTIGAWVCSEPMQRASVVRALGVWGLKSKTKSDRWPGGLAAEYTADNAHVEVVCSST
jgi:hypothetical protein